MNQIVREVIEMELHSNNMNKEIASLCMRKSWNPHIYILKEQKQALAKDMAHTSTRPSSTHGSYKVLP
jgi:hypothetical protein